MFRRGRRFFTSGSIGLILVALAHTAGHFSSDPEGLAASALEAAMKAYRLDLGLGMRPSMFDVVQGLNLTMSVALLGLGVLGIVLAAGSDTPPRLLNRLAIIYALIVAALVVLFAYYRVPPPLVTLAVVEGLFLGAVFVGSD